ncbi:MAG: UMP kinase [Oscillospiraceae bacterium]|nr:UMP kinase [Oscillospiraceae bacterium]
MENGKIHLCKGGIPLEDQIQYKRVLLKVSGEALAGDAHRGLDFDVIGQVCAVIKRCVEAGVQVGVVVGGGNFWRGIKDGGDRMQRVRADHMGMLATVINALAVADRLEQQGVDARVMTSIDMPRIAEPYIRDKAVSHLEKGRVVVFGCGTGNPFFSTDTGAVLKAVEIGADAILLAKNIDGVYSADPAKDPSAVRFDRISFDEVLARRLGVMDSTATSLAMDNHMPILVFALKDPENIYRVVTGAKIGTLVTD